MENQTCNLNTLQRGGRMNDDVVAVKMFGATIVKFSNKSFVKTEQEELEILKQFKMIGYNNLKNLHKEE